MGRRFASVSALGAMVLIALSLVVVPANGERTETVMKFVSVVSVAPVSPPQHRGTGALRGGTVNTVTAGTDLSFRVEVRNTADRGLRVPVTLVIGRGTGGHTGSPIVRKATLDVGPTQTGAVVIANIKGVWFAAPSKLKVTLGTGKVTTYPVIFTLP